LRILGGEHQPKDPRRSTYQAKMYIAIAPRERTA